MSPEPTEASADRWDLLVVGGAVGFTIVLIAFLVVFGIVYFTSDYEFLTAAEAPTPAGVVVPASAPASGSGLDGETIARSADCLGCHSVDGSRIVGPTWQGLAGSTRTFTDGSTAIADSAYLIRSIKDPSAQVVDGFPDNIMLPDLAERLTSDEIDAVVAYIESLG